MPFWLSRSTRISTRMRGHSHSVTRVAIEYGSSSRVTAQQLLADQLGDPLGLGHVGHHVGRVVAAAPRAAARRGGRRARRRPHRCGPTRGSRPRRPARPRPPAGRRPAPGWPGRPCSPRPRGRRAAGGHPPVTPAEGLGGVEHEAHHVDAVEGARWPCGSAARRARVTGLCRPGRVDEHELGVGAVQHAAHLVARGLGLVRDDAHLLPEDGVEQRSTCPRSVARRGTRSRSGSSPAGLTARGRRPTPRRWPRRRPPARPRRC